jgi:cytochrome P450
MADLGSFADEGVQRCPYPFIRALHEHAPLYKDPKTGFYIVSRYADISYINSKPELFSNKTHVVVGGDQDTEIGLKIEAMYRERGAKRVHTLVTNDPPSHGVYRGMVDRIFTASFVKSMESYICDLVEELIDDFIDSGSFDMKRDFCFKLPISVIADQMGLPREDWMLFRRWSEAVLALVNPTIDPEMRVHFVEHHLEMQKYFFDQLEPYRRQPVDKLLSLLANAKIEGEYLSVEEYTSIAEQFLVAGNETTTAALAHAIAILIKRPDLADTLRGDPAKIPNFVEEVLRLHSPIMHIYRRVVEDTELHGVALPAETILDVCYLAGNYDEERFPDAGELRLDRSGSRNHLSFGRGIHYCIGNLLSRAELRIALERLLARVGAMRFDPAHGEPPLSASFQKHDLEFLHVCFDRR